MSAALLIILLLGCVLGLSVGLVGTGSVLAVPLLVYAGGLDVHSAVCVSMLTMTLLGFSGSIQKLHAGAVDLGAATLIGISGALFAPLGSWLNKQLSHTVLLVLFALVVLAMSIGMLLQRESNANGASQSADAVRSRSVVAFGSGAAGAIIGLLGGFLGISGGFIAVPVLVPYQGLEMHRGVATSWATVTLASASATIGHFIAGQRLALGNTLLFLIGGIIGFQFAVRIAQYFSGAGLKRPFAAAVLIMSVVMLARLLLWIFPPGLSQPRTVRASMAACVTDNRATSANQVRSVGSSVRGRAPPDRARRCACSPSASGTPTRAAAPLSACTTSC